MNQKTKLAIALAMSCEKHADCLELMKAFIWQGATLDYDDVTGQALSRLRDVELNDKQKCTLVFFFSYLIDKCVGNCRNEYIAEANALFSN